MLASEEVIFLSSYKQKMQKEDFFKMVRIRFEKQVSEERKKWKKTFCNLVSVENGKKIIFSLKMRARVRGDMVF